MHHKNHIRDRLLQLEKSVRDDLLGNILPFWYWIRSGYSITGALQNDLSPATQSPVSLVMVARLLWTYSRAHRLFGDDKSIEFAGWIYNFLCNFFHDQKNDGYVWWISGEGRVLSDKKQTYGQAFVVYAFSEFARASGSGKSLQQAMQLFHLIEKHCWNTQLGGYWEAVDCEWSTMDDVRLSEKDLNAPFSMNTHLHIVEAYSNLLAASKEDLVADRLRNALNVVEKRILHTDGNRFGLFYDRDWNLLTKTVSPGHDIEGSWLLCEAAELLGDARVKARMYELALEMVNNVALNGMGSGGYIRVEYDPGGLKSTATDWWPQAEGVVGFLNAFQLSGDEDYLNNCLNVWNYIEENLIDHTHGEWYAGRKVNGDPLDAEKAGPWKSSYHNGRMGYEVIQRIKLILNKLL